MKCPKCSYISFDTPDRCRNCGYDFPLASATSAPADGDLVLRQADEHLDAREAGDLPLFGAEPELADLPVIPAASSRTPLSVRRSPSDPSRQPPPRRERRTGGQAPTTPLIVTVPVPARGDVPPLLVGHDDGPEADVVPEATADPFARSDAADVSPEPAVSRLPGGDTAPAMRRLGAAAIDALILVAIDLVVVHATLAVVGWKWARVLELRWTPLVLFFVLVNGGYLVAFTVASGQTIGKMLLGVRVVGAHALRIPVTQAVVRVCALVVALLPLGLGYLPGLFGRRAQGLHDRLARTRVMTA